MSLAESPFSSIAFDAMLDKHPTACLKSRFPSIFKFDKSFREGKLRKGDLVILVGFWAGLTYGANLLRF